jgi:hypothetical protein
MKKKKSALVVITGAESEIASSLSHQDAAPKGKLPGPLSLSLFRSRTLNIIPSAPTQTTIYRDAPRGMGLAACLPAESNRTAQK